jgi:hypothetical protein
MRNYTFKTVTACLAVSVFAFFGTFYLLTSHAATSFVAAEVEQGAVLSPAATISDTAVSAGNLVQFKSAVLPPSADPVIAAAGDIACASGDSSYKAGAGTATACRQKYTALAASSLNPAAYLVLGDAQYNSGALTEFTKAYDSSWGAFKTKTYPVIGNHEYGNRGGSGYFNYFGDAATPRQPGCRTACQGYYSFDIGSWHLIALNSECTNVPGGCAAGSPQETWLKADLAAHPTACTLAFDHEAYWASSTLKSTAVKPLMQDLYTANADVILSGHSHTYERFGPQDMSNKADSARGLRQFVVGTGGAFFTGVGTAVPNSQVRQATVYGVLQLTLHANSYDWKFVPESGKTYTDAGTGTCH